MGEARLDLLYRLIERVERYARTVSREQLESDLDTWLMVSRALELVAQCCVDLGAEILSARGLGAPDTYREVFLRLQDGGLLSEEDARTLAGWAGLRNVLAHVYTQIDLDLLYAALTGDLGALRRLAGLAAQELLGGDGQGA